MNKLFTKIAGSIIGMAMAIGVGVAVGRGEVREAKAGEEVYKTLDFPDDNSENNKVGAYSKTWTAMKGTDSWTIYAFNNNNWGWTVIKAGNKTVDYEATITTDSAYSAAITKVVVTVSAYTTQAGITNTKLEVASDSDFTQNLQTINVAAASGNLTYTVPSPAANRYYRLTYVCPKYASANGYISISKIQYYYNNAGPSLSVSPSSAIISKDGTQVLTATATGGSGNVSWVTSNSDIVSISSATGASITATGEARGKATITASYSTAADVPVEIQVTNVIHTGTAADNYSVEEARDQIDLETGLTGVYVSGIVSEITTAYNSTYGNISFNMSVDGLTTSEQLRAYRATGSEASNIAVGNIVVMNGDLTKYGTTYELDEGCTIISRTAPTYTVSFNNNGGSGTMANVTEVSGDYTLPECTFTAPNGKMFNGWKANNEGALLAVDSTYSVLANVTFYASWANKLSITYHANGGTGENVVAYWPEGSSATIAANTFTPPEGMAFNKWNTSDNGEGTQYAANATINPFNSSIDLYAQWKVTPQEKKDTLTLASFGTVSDYNTYNAIGSVSNTPYVGYMMASGVNMQFKSKNSVSGIVNTTSKGTVKSVKITVASGDNTIDIYGSNTAYSDPADLYGDSKGTKVGSLTATGTVTFESDYDYVGIRSNNGALYISQIEITWLVVPKAVDHIGASSVGEGPFYVGTKPTLAQLGVTVTAYYNQAGTDSEIVTTLASITYPNTGLVSGANNYTISYGGKTTTISITGTVGDVFGKLTLTSELIVGSTIRIGTDAYVMTSTAQSSQLTGLEGDATNANLSGAAEFTVGADGEGYYFYETTEEKYLSLGSDNSYLSLNATLNTNAHWHVSISNVGNATITNATYTDRFIEKNGSHRFASFKGGETAVSIFQLVDNSMTEQQKTAAQIETFAKLFLRSEAIALNVDTHQDTGACKGDSGYYLKAKAALAGDWSAISSSLQSDTSGAKARYVAWAAACGDATPFDGLDHIDGGSQGIIPSMIADKNNASLIITVISVLSLTALGGFFFIKKRKEN